MRAVSRLFSTPWPAGDTVLEPRVGTSADAARTSACATSSRGSVCEKYGLAAGEPVISVDTKKKELVGDFKDKCREWHPKGQPEAVNVHDFIDPKLGRAIPYGIYDIGDNKGWVGVGADRDTARFAVHAIDRWWLSMGQRRYPNATRLLVTADGGGSNGHRVRLWKVELQELSNTLRFPITVCHLPPGTSKWNKIEHRLFSFLTINWRGKPLRSFQTIVQLIAAKTTTTGLTVRAELDENKYPKGVKTSDAKFAALNIARHPFHGDWNDTISPSTQGSGYLCTTPGPARSPCSADSPTGR